MLLNGAIQIKDQEELSNYGGGTIEISLDATDGGTATIEVKDKDGNIVITDTMSGTGVYEEHGIKFELLNYGTTNGNDKININIVADSYKVEAALDGGA